MISVGMSTTCVYPFAVEHAFRIARLAGFDSMEVMVTNDPVTQDAAKLREISERYELRISTIHAPVLLLTSFVWGRDPQVKLEKSAELAADVGAETVVVHPPFRWQSGYAQNFERIVRQTAQNSGIGIAVENMFPWTVKGRSMKAYAPSPDPLDLDVDQMTLDFSHASLSGRDSLEMAIAMGDKLTHIHLCDGRTSAADGAILDEHLLPGEGTQPVAETLQYLAARDWKGNVVAEVNVRQEKDEAYRLRRLIETVAFAREHLSQEHTLPEPISAGRDDLPLKIRQARRHDKKSARG